MLTVNEMLNLAARAPAQKAALERLVAAGHGAAYCTTYGGTAYATAACSNAAKTRKYLVIRGYTVLAEEAGPRRRYRSEGHRVFVAFS